MHTCTGRMGICLGKVVICGKKEKKGKLIRKWGWESTLTESMIFYFLGWVVNVRSLLNHLFSYAGNISFFFFFKVKKNRRQREASSLSYALVTSSQAVTIQAAWQGTETMRLQAKKPEAWHCCATRDLSEPWCFTSKNG